jgi:hypothetical protein
MRTSLHSGIAAITECIVIGLFMAGAAIVAMASAAAPFKLHY